MRALFLFALLFGITASADISQTNFVCNDKENKNIEVKIDLKSGYASVYDLLGNKMSEDNGKFQSYCRGLHKGLQDCSHELPKEGSLKGYMRVYKEKEGFIKYYDLVIQGKRYVGHCS